MATVHGALSVERSGQFPNWGGLGILRHVP
jgi:hypothetical protein